VHVRVRPLSESEQSRGGSAWRLQGRTLTPLDSSSGGYSLDQVYDEGCSNEQVYAGTAQSLVREVARGFHATVFAYGQTSSGKTHTMMGTAEDPGLVPRAVRELFSLIAQARRREFLLRASYMEIYNEEIIDLLAPGEAGARLGVQESREGGGAQVVGLREELVTCPEDVLGLLARGEGARHVGETRMNARSSRSHAIFRMVVESRARQGEGRG
ncbi:kinesin, partial [Helicosporidium sp. ATCC 50920]